MDSRSEDVAGCPRLAASLVGYRRRRPQETVLYEVVRENAETLFAEARAKTGGARGYPKHVEEEFRRYIECGILGHGFMRVRCPSCGKDELVAFSCKRRTVCVSCVGRRMADLAAYLVDRCLPQEAGYRQWVFSFPRRLRMELAKDGKLLSNVLGLCVRKVFAWQKKKARQLGIRNPRPLAVLLVQRFGSLLQLNPHGHAVFADGVFVQSERAGGEKGLRFLELAAPEQQDVESVGLAIAKGVLKVLSGRAGAVFFEDEEPEAQALLSAMAETSQVALPTSKEADGDEEVVGIKKKRRTAVIETELGVFSIHANTQVAQGDRQSLERLIRYCARPVIAQKRLSRTRTGKVCYRLRRPYYTGQTEIVLEPVAFLRRLAALLPPRRQNQVRFYGLLAGRARERPALVALVKKGGAESDSLTATDEDTNERGTTATRYRQTWAALLKRVFKEDVLRCPSCPGQRKIISAVTEPALAKKILAHLQLPTDMPTLAPARAPPQAEFEFFAD